MRLNAIYETFTQSRSRVRAHSRPGRSFGILTAWRGGNSPAQNNARNRQLLDDLKAAGLTARPVQGGYIERGRGDQADQYDAVQEDSYFVFGRDWPDQQLVQQLHQLGNKYDQDSILFKPAQDFPIPGGVLPAHHACLVMRDGEIAPLGPFSAAQSQYYTGLKGDRPGKGRVPRADARFSFGEPVPIEGKLVVGYALWEGYDSLPTGRLAQHQAGRTWFGE